MIAITVGTSKNTILSHFETTGACEELRDWMDRQVAEKVTYIAFPFLNSQSRHVEVEQHIMGERRHHRSFIGFKKPAPVAYIRDFIYAIIYGIRFARGADILVTGDCLLAVAGIVLRYVGITKRVIYYMIDYTPIRFHNRLVNATYLWMDRTACRYADQVWPLSEQMIAARFEDGRITPEAVNWQVVPYGNHPVQADSAPGISRCHVAYMGGLSREKGADLFVPIAQQLVARGIDVQFIVIGDGDYREELREQAMTAGILDRFDFKGYVEDVGEALSTLACCGVAIAPYNPHDTNSPTPYADSGKLKLYLGCGVPIVLTDLPSIASTIAAKGAGLIADHSAEDIAEKIYSIITADDYDDYRKQARCLGAEYSWDAIFTRAFEGLPA